MTHRFLATFCALLALNGCGPEDEPEPSADVGTQCLASLEAPAEATAIELSYRDQLGTLHELTDGVAIEQQFGFQGGSHIDVVARVYGIDGEVEVSLDDGQGFAVSSAGDIPDCDGWAEAQGRVFDPIPGTGLTLTVRITGGSQELTETFTVDIQ